MVWLTNVGSRTSPFFSGGCGDGLSASADRLNCSMLGCFDGSLVETKLRAMASAIIGW